MTILITGATGFIGKYLCLTLMQQGHDVKALTRSKSSLTQLTGFLEQQGVAMERFSALEGDLEKPDLGLVTLPNGIECIVHLAARFAWNLPEHEAHQRYRQSSGGGTGPPTGLPTGVYYGVHARQRDTPVTAWD